MKDRLAILSFHGVGEPPRGVAPDEGGLWVRPYYFGEMLDAVRAISMVKLTFDGAHRSDVEVVLPALESRGLRAEFFVCANRIGQEGSLSRSDLEALRDSGMAVGTLGMRHVAWRGLGDEALREEVVVAKDMIEDQLGAMVTTAACPFGSYDRRVLAALRAAGYMRVYTADGGPADPRSWLQPRNTIGAKDTASSVAGLVARPGGAAPWRAITGTIRRWR